MLLILATPPYSFPIRAHFKSTRVWQATNTKNTKCASMPDLTAPKRNKNWLAAVGGPYKKVKLFPHSLITITQLGVSLSLKIRAVAPT